MIRFIFRFSLVAAVFLMTFACKLLAGAAIPPFMAAMIPIVVFTPLAILTLDSIKT